jgi:hypothetical protein
MQWLLSLRSPGIAPQDRPPEQKDDILIFFIKYVIIYIQGK